MSTLILILPDHKTVWSQSVPGVPTLALARRVRRGEWQLPDAWRDCLAQRYSFPDGLDLELRVHSGCVVLVSRLPGEPRAGQAQGLLLRLSRGSSRVLRERLAGATCKEIYYRRKQRRARADEQIRQIMGRAGRAARQKGK